MKEQKLAQLMEKPQFYILLQILRMGIIQELHLRYMKPMQTIDFYFQQGKKSEFFMESLLE